MAEEFIIRLAEPRDVKNVFELSNDDTVRAMSIHPEKIEWESHVKWFENTLKNPAVLFYVAETADGDFIGQVRFFHDNTDWIISISLVKKYRGKGLGTALLKRAMKKSYLKNCVAYVEKGNVPSQKMFLSLGYKQVGTTELNKKVYLMFRYSPIFIIAEMSANHCGDKELAKKIISAAKEAGADAVKIQTYTADTLTIDCHNPEFKLNGGLWDGKYLYDLYQEAYTPWEWQGELKEYADSIGIPLFSTPFDFTAVDFLETLNVPMYKIASFEAFDYPLIKYAARCGKPMIISTGVSSLEEIQGAIDACKSVGNSDITLLKCTSAYPAKIEDMNLMTIKDMIDRFGPQGVKIGLSDHSMSIVPPVAAVAMGAKVIEKHFTLDRTLGGADSGFSLNAEEFAAMVQAVRDTEKSLGKADYTVNEQNRKFACSLYVVKDIKAGEKFTAENVSSIRPSNGLHPKYYEEILGKTAARNLPFGTALTLEDIK